MAISHFQPKYCERERVIPLRKIATQLQVIKPKNDPEPFQSSGRAGISLPFTSFEPGAARKPVRDNSSRRCAQRGGIRVAHAGRDFP